MSAPEHFNASIADCTDYKYKRKFQKSHYIITRTYFCPIWEILCGEIFFTWEKYFQVISMIKKMSVLILAILYIFQSECICVQAQETIKLPILMYHQISPNRNSWNDYVISPEEFREDMEYINSLGWESIGIKDLLAWQRGEFEMPEKPVMITFDDGFRSLIEYAEPVLEEFGYKGVAAIIGSLCDQNNSENQYPGEWDYLDWNDAMEISKRGIMELQCHSWDLHSSKSNAGCAKRWGETLQAYRRRLSEDLSKFISEFEKRKIDFCYTMAYPYGSYDRYTCDVVKDMGFDAAFTCTEKINILTGDPDELYYLGRFNRPHGISSEKYFTNIKKSVDIE